jgi:ABC-type branched-subunit amino acid transport system ATPase component
VDKRLVEIARALALRPAVLALDEPAAGLSAEDKAKLGTLLRRIAASGVAVVLVEHDMQLIMSVSDSVVVLDAGERIAGGTPSDVSADPAVIRAYLGSTRADTGHQGRRARAVGELVLDVKGLSSGYGPISVVSDLDLAVGQGELVAILGANGAGKSTLVRALAGLNRPIGGSVLFADSRLEALSADRIAALGLVLVPEGRQVFPELSVLDNLKLGAFARGGEDAEKRREALLDRFPRLRERAHSKAGLLSGGEQQMLAIARGLMAQPRVLMLDEPSLGLAPRLIETLYEVVAELRDEGITILLVDQMAALALSVADRGYALRAGRVVASGTAAELMADDTLTEAYLGGRQKPAIAPVGPGQLVTNGG